MDGDGNEVVRLQWDGIGLPWNAVNGERATLVSGSIRPLYPVTRVEGSYCPGYKIQPGSKISFSDVPAGTLQLTKREDGIITTVESDFAGGTLELTEPDLLDTKVVDSDGSELFALGKKVGDTVFDVVNPTQTGEISGNVEVVEREVAWALEFDGTGEVNLGNPPALNLGLSNFSWYVSYVVNKLYSHTMAVFAKDNVHGFREQVSSFGASHPYIYWHYDSDGKIPYRNQRYYSLDLSSSIVSTVSVDRENKVRFYREGVLVSEQTPDLPPNPEDGYMGGSADFRIGQWWASPFVGLTFLPLIIAPTAWDQTTVSRLTQRDFSCIRPEDTVLWLDYDPSTGQLIDRSPYNHQIQMVGGVQVRRVMI